MAMHWWVRDKYADGEFSESQPFASDLKAGDFEWLGNQVAVTPWGIFSGRCDSYGGIDGDFEGGASRICVLKLNWSAIPKKRRKNPWDDGDESTFGELPGVLVHEDCYNQFLRKHVQDALARGALTHAKLFRKFDAVMDDMCQELACVPAGMYGDITKNCGQDYELHANEGHLVAPLVPLWEIPGVHRNRPRERLLPSLPVDIMLIVCLHLDTPALVSLSQVSKSGYDYGRFFAFWETKYCFLGNDGVLRIFKCASSMRNYQRVRPIADIIVEKVILGDTGVKSGADESKWGHCSVMTLQHELLRQGLPTTGNKAELIRRLEEEGS